MNLRPLIPAALLLAACSGDAPTGPAAPDSPDAPSLLSLARAYHMTGEARTTSTDGRTAECALDLVFELRDRTGHTRDYVEYAGVHGGDATRAVTTEDGSGFAFSAFVFGDMTMRRYRDGRIEIRIPINETTDVPFYREMAQWEGEVARGRRLAGEWRCGPLQINEGGYVDLDLTAEGTWRLEPQH